MKTNRNIYCNILKCFVKKALQFRGIFEWSLWNSRVPWNTALEHGHKHFTDLVSKFFNQDIYNLLILHLFLFHELYI